MHELVQLQYASYMFTIYVDSSTFYNPHHNPECSSSIFIHISQICILASGPKELLLRTTTHYFFYLEH